MADRIGILEADAGKEKGRPVARCFSCLVRFVCCCRPKKKPVKYDPYVFLDDSHVYHACFGCIHVKRLAVFLVLIKTVALFAFVCRQLFASSSSSLSNIACVFITSATTVSYILVIVGVQIKRYTFIIPYFTICVLVILVMIMQLFMDFLDTANRKTTLDPKAMAQNAALLSIIAFEIYTLSVVWKAFIYVNDFQMNVDLHSKERRERLNSIFIKRDDEGLMHNHLIPIKEESDEEPEVPVNLRKMTLRRSESIVA